MRAGLEITWPGQAPRGRVARWLQEIEAAHYLGWWARVDLAIIGGDPMTVCAVLEAARRRRDTDGWRIALLRPSGGSAAPMGALDDPAFAARIIGDMPWHEAFGAGARAGLEAVASRVSRMADVGGWQGWRHERPLRAAPVAAGSVISLARPDPGARAAVQIDIARPGAGAGGRLLARSHHLETEGWRAMARHWTRPPPLGRRIMDAMICDRVIHLHGAVGGRECPDWHRGVFAGAVPETAAAAAAGWRTELARWQPGGSAEKFFAR